jgi:hypothetical protein
MKKITGPIILGIITVTELIVTHEMGSSIFLWIGYGVIRLFRWMDE